MKQTLHIILALLLFGVCACDKQRVSDSNDYDTEEDELNFDFSQFYYTDTLSVSFDKDIYTAHKCVPIDQMVALDDLDSIFGKPMFCDTIWQTKDWSLWEQDYPAYVFMPTEIGDTLVMMRRIYGRQGDWMVWIDLEIQESSDSLRALYFIAYDNSYIEM